MVKSLEFLNQDLLKTISGNIKSIRKYGDRMIKQLSTKYLGIGVEAARMMLKWEGRKTVMFYPDGKKM